MSGLREGFQGLYDDTRRLSFEPSINGEVVVRLGDEPGFYVFAADLQHGVNTVIQQALHPAEPAPVASRERVGEVLSGATRDMDYKRWETPQGMQPYVDALFAAGVFRDEATVQSEVAEKIAEIAEEAADDLDLPVMAEWLDQRDWFKDQLHALAAKAREAGGVR